MKLMNTILISLFKIFVGAPVQLVYFAWTFRYIWNLYNIPWECPSRMVLIGLGFILTLSKLRIIDWTATIMQLRQYKDYEKKLEDEDKLVDEASKVVVPILAIFVVHISADFYHWLLNWYMH